eukprot:COSAG02_NODE_1382_length_12967_cov_9.151694_5_plen_302_part_00
MLLRLGTRRRVRLLRNRGRLSASVASSAAVYAGQPEHGYCKESLHSYEHRPIRVLVAGGGVAGCIITSQLLRTPGVQVDIVERRGAGELPRGLNLLLNHNGMAALADVDPSLEAALRSIGTDTTGWSARTMTGEVLYDLPNVQTEGLADMPGMVGRWDEVNATLQAACAGRIRFGTAVSGWHYTPENHLSVTLTALGAEDETTDPGNTVDEEYDLLLACDGRYSQIRQILDASDPQQENIDGSLVTCKFGVFQSPGPVQDSFTLRVHDAELVSLLVAHDASRENAVFWPPLYRRLSACGPR